NGDSIAEDGVKMMGVIAFVMLIASGYASVLQETGSVDELVNSVTVWLGDSKFLTVLILMLVGLLVTIGIGTSFGTVPVFAAIFVQMCISMGFSPLANATMIVTAGAIGDAGSQSTDSKLGPKSDHNVYWQ